MNGDFDGFYHANYGDTVTMVYGYTAELTEAQDIAQEAFCRAWQRWSRVSSYDNPAAWVRRVATNLAHSRWKRARRAAAHLVRQRVTETPPIDPEHVAVVAALRKLPLPQRKALVLHHIVDLPVDEVAEHLDAPVNTVKSWLHRGRSALANELRLDIRDEIRDGIRDGIVSPPAEAVAGKARRKRTARRAGFAAVIVMVVAGAIAAIRFAQPGPAPVPITPTPSPTQTPAPAPSPSPSLPAIMTIQFTKGNPDREPLTFVAGRHQTGSTRTWLASPFWIDLDGDGRDELLVDILCQFVSTMMGCVGRNVVLQIQPDGTLREIAERPGGAVISARAGVIHVDDSAGDGGGPGRTAMYAWNGSAFVRLGSRGYPRMEIIDLTDVASQLTCDNLSLPSALRLSFDWDSVRWAHENGRKWSIGDVEQWITLRGKDYYLMDLTCQPEADGKPAMSRYPILFAWAGTGWRPVAVVPVRFGSRYGTVETNGDRLTLWEVSGRKSAEFDWNDREFIAR